jgi:hypothetical protein
MDKKIIGISLRDVRKLLDDKSPGEKIFEAVDTLLGFVIAISPIVAGPGAVPLWSLLEPKTELVNGLRVAVKKLTGPQPGDYLDRAEKMAAANCLLTFTAYFDALGQRLPRLMRNLKLKNADKRLVVARAVGNGADGSEESLSEERLPGPGVFSTADLASMVICMPHPAAYREADLVRLRIYEDMGAALLRLLSDLEAWRRLPEHVRVETEWVISRMIPRLADDMYRAQYVGLAIDSQPFFVWTVLEGEAQRAELIEKVGTDVRTQFELIGSAVYALDLGLQRLAIVIGQLPQARGGISQPGSLGLGAIAEELHIAYRDGIEKPVIDDRDGDDGDGPSLVYPRKVDSYVPQAYRLLRYDNKEMHLEQEDAWDDSPVQGDVGPYIMRHIESPYSVQTPLLVLGHPGSGKSLLTEVVAACLAYPQYTTVRVKLRDVDPDIDVQGQIEAQIREDTGRDVNWVDFTSDLALSPPVVILDGYDELLQATGKLFTGYLEDVRRFQYQQALQKRPVRVIVTSRITLIDKVLVPHGSTVLRLEDFDEERRNAWIQVWNHHNKAYFQLTRTRPLRLPANIKVLDLARQPLLLLMLALYDSSGNKLSAQPDLDQTVLYDALLRRFIARELSKGDDGVEFVALNEAARKVAIGREMERLGVAAIGMFNRQDVKILRDQLNADLYYFEAESGGIPDGTRQLSQADRLFGSFFFIHESRSRLAEDSVGPVSGPAAFEFLHNTFGEFLAADFILRKVLAEADEVCELAANTRREDRLRRYLTAMSPGWFACLIHTPLHTRPNILALLKEWGTHRLAGEARSRVELLQALDTIVTAQLRSLLYGTVLPDLSARGPDGKDAPYTSLPAFAHLSIYSLNLILLRCFLANETNGETYALDETGLDMSQSGCRPWDRLVSLWRSWFSSESLGTLASLFTASRMDSLIMTDPHPSPLAISGITGRHIAYNVCIALADNAGAASMGIHVFARDEISEQSFRQLLERALPEAPELAPVAESLVLRKTGTSLTDLAAFLVRYPNGYPTDDSQIYEIPKASIPGYLLNIAEAVDRMMITPRQRAQLASAPVSMAELASLTRYEAELAVHSRITLEPRWLPNMFLGQGEMASSDNPGTWSKFLGCPAAAPVLRAVCQVLGDAQYAAVAATAGGALPPDQPIEAFDVDTAASLAVLAWRGRQENLCARALDSVILGCEHGGQSLLDVPAETWSGIADLFMSDGREIIARKNRFIALLNGAIGESFEFGQENGIPLAVLLRGFADVWIHALRVGATAYQNVIIAAVLARVNDRRAVRSDAERRSILLLIRWARERNDHGFIGRFNGNWPLSDLIAADRLDQFRIDEISTELTYREAMDLAWAIDAWAVDATQRARAVADRATPPDDRATPPDDRATPPDGIRLPWR